MHKSLKIFIFLFFLSAQFPLFGQSEWNLNFEQWDSTHKTPELWHDTTVVENRTPIFPASWHFRAGHIAEGRGLARTTDATQGEYAVALSGFYTYQVMRIVSGDDPLHPGWPIDFQPIQLSGDYKAILLGDCDSLRVYVDVFLTSFDPEKGTRDTVGRSSLVLKESDSYSGFDLDIEYENALLVPDTVTIVLAKKRFGFDLPPDCLECSHVFFDDLKLTATVSDREPKRSGKKVGIFPNPASHSVAINSECGDCRYNMTFIGTMGKIVRRDHAVMSGSSVDLIELNKGIYQIRIEAVESGNVLYKKLIIQ